MRTIAIIPAGGKGERSGHTVPKQYLKFNEKELIVYTLEIFQRNDSINAVIVAAESEYFNLLNKLKKDYRLTKIEKIVQGGEERQDSVYSALRSVEALDDDLIAVHDAARPLLPDEVLKIAINAAKEKGNAVVCLKNRDTLLKGKLVVEDYVDRNEIYQVQTPQIFKYGELKKAMEWAYENNFRGTDESMLAKKIGIDVNIVEGSIFNFKVTTAAEIRMMNKLVSLS